MRKSKLKLKASPLHIKILLEQRSRGEEVDFSNELDVLFFRDHFLLRLLWSSKISLLCFVTCPFKFHWI